MKISLTNIPIGTRDGTLGKDSKTVNVLGGKTRPGTTLLHQYLSTGWGLMLDDPTYGPLALVGDSLYLASGAYGLLGVIPGGNGGPYDVSLPLPNTVRMVKNSLNVWIAIFPVISLATGTPPTNMTAGYAFLDGTFYVLQKDGTIRGSAMNDPNNWNPLNSLMLNADLGVPVGIARHLNYIIAFATNFISFYYNAGNPSPGSPLSIVSNAYTDVGCVDGTSIVELGGTLMFVGQTAARGRGVYILSGLRPERISDLAVDRVLERNMDNPFRGSTISIEGKTLYILELVSQSCNLVYDLHSKQWGIWSMSVAADPTFPGYLQASFPYNSSVTAHLPGNTALTTLALHNVAGQLVVVGNTTASDGLPIDLQFVTSIIEGESSDYVRIASAEVIGDKLPVSISSTLYVRFSDDDYATWSAWRPVNLATSRSQVIRQGATRRRAYQLRYCGTFPLNLRTLQLDVVG